MGDNTRDAREALVTLEIALEGGSHRLESSSAHPTVAPADTAYAYTGKHDHGDLPPLRSSGFYADLLSAVDDVKRQADAILTAEIAAVIGRSAAAADNEPSLEEEVNDDEGIAAKMSKRQRRKK